MKRYIQKLFYGSSTLIRAAALGIYQFVFISYVHAANDITGITFNNPGDVNTKILCPILSWMYTILISVSVIVVLVGAYMYMTSSGDPEKVSKATKTLTYAAIGIVVAILARGLPALIGSIFGISGGLSVC